MGTVSVTTFSSDTETVTRTKLNGLAANLLTEFNGNIEDANIKAAAAIDDSKLNLANIAQNIQFDGTSTFGGNVTFASETIADLGTVTAATITNCTLSNDPTFTSKSGLVPVGCILLWSGAVSAVPTGWGICDGSTYGTTVSPNLTDRFVIHASADSGDTYDVDDTGGAAAVTLTAAQSGIAAHTHDGVYTVDGGSGEGEAETIYNETGTTGAVTGGAASAASAHTNLPPYYALAYIIKTDA